MDELKLLSPAPNKKPGCARCTSALNEYMAQMQTTCELLSRLACKPGGISIAEHLEIVRQRERESEARSKFANCRRALFIELGFENLSPRRRKDDEL